MSAAPEPARFRILYVCTGNVCRSPFAEILTRHLLAERLGKHAAAAFDVTSAGVRAVVGASIDPDTRRQLATVVPDDSATACFVARQLTPMMIERADLILALTPAHRSVVVEECPRVVARAFSLRELARLSALVDLAALPATPVERAAALGRQARQARSLAPPSHVDIDDVPDPAGLPPRAHLAAATRITAAVRSVVEVIAPTTRADRPSSTRLG